MKAVCPFLERIPDVQHEDFLDDIIKAVVDMKLRDGDINARDFKFIAPYKLVVVYARKRNEYLSSMIEEAERLAKGLH